MQRPKKAYNSRFKPYEGRKQTDKHCRLTHDMMMSKNFINLSPNARSLYIYMKLWASGQETFKYSISMAKILMTAPTFEKAKNELISCGFLDHTNILNAKYQKVASEFMFSSRWSKE